GGVSIIIISYWLWASASSSSKRWCISSSDGLGGTVPRNTTLSPSTLVLWVASARLWRPLSTPERPTLASIENELCRRPRRRSASSKSTFWPVWASTTARLVHTKVLPTLGAGPEKAMILLDRKS